PRSSGCTRTSSSSPRRNERVFTRTSSGLSTMPRTRCSSASASTSGFLGGLRLLRGLRRLVGAGGAFVGLLGGGLLGLGGRLSGLRLAELGLLLGRLDRRGPDLLCGRGVLGAQARGGAVDALELLPVAGDLQQCRDLLGGLGA